MDSNFRWIRGVNIGGWLLAERFITPYLFAVTDCHLKGDFCFYDGQLSAPPSDHPEYKRCVLSESCKPHLVESVTGEIDFPTDEWTLAASFPDKEIARRYLDFHWDNFVGKQDLVVLKEAGVTHVRVPLPHWILGDIHPSEPWVDGGWPYFIRFLGWARDVGIDVWPDIHTAPGSQNGFDNSGRLMPGEPTCAGWMSNDDNVARSLRILESVATKINVDGYADVVTGFGILNEPFEDCNIANVKKFNEDALMIVRRVLGRHMAVYIADLFHSSRWNDGYWTNPQVYSNTFLDSHYYHVFAEEPRALSPKQHIAYVCGKNRRDTVACCYEDFPNNTIPSGGISRMIGEWSASYDTLPVAKLGEVMHSIARTGAAIDFNRTISPQRKAFLKQFVEAQIVTYEAVETGVSTAWFYWTLRMEGGAFAEWDFLRGLREGWFPGIPPPDVSSQDLYGSCRSIAEDTVDDPTIVQEFPDPSTLEGKNWQGVVIDDDFVLTHAGSDIVSSAVESETENSFEAPDSNSLIQYSLDSEDTRAPRSSPDTRTNTSKAWLLLFSLVALLGAFLLRQRLRKEKRAKATDDSVGERSFLLA